MCVKRVCKAVWYNYITSFHIFLIFFLHATYHDMFISIFLFNIASKANCFSLFGKQDALHLYIVFAFLCQRVHVLLRSPDICSTSFPLMDFCVGFTFTYHTKKDVHFANAVYVICFIIRVWLNGMFSQAKSDVEKIDTNTKTRNFKLCWQCDFTVI